MQWVFLPHSLIQRWVCWLLFIVPWQLVFKTASGEWREEQGSGGSKGIPLSEIRAKTLTSLVQNQINSANSILVYFQSCPVFGLKYILKIFIELWLCVFDNLFICLFLFQSSVHPEKITSPLTFLPVCDVSLHSLLLSHLQMWFLWNGTENTAEWRSVNSDGTLWHDQNNDQSPPAIFQTDGS